MDLQTALIRFVPGAGVAGYSCWHLDLLVVAMTAFVAATPNQDDDALAKLKAISRARIGS